MDAAPLVLRDVDLDGRRADVRVVDGGVAEIGPRLDLSPTDDVVEGAGGALLPGLHDHHIHLLALAAAQASVRVGPPEVTDRDDLQRALRQADATLLPTVWLRAAGYHESVAGPLDRSDLDSVVPHRPVRVQHRSGALWILNSAAIAEAAVDEAGAVAGLERDADGVPTGRLFGLDDWLADRLPDSDEAPDLTAVGGLLARHGVTAVTDATPAEQPSRLEPIAAAVATGDLPQHVVVTGGPHLDPGAAPALSRGPVKLVLSDLDLPPLDTVVGWVRAARRQCRAVAIHCVTREALVLALTALDEVGAVEGDRIEHAAVVPVELIPRLRDLDLTVVTQPNLVAERGDHYLDAVEPDDQPHLWRCGTLLAGGVAVAGSTDAPFGDPNPWLAIAAATERRTRDGRQLGPDECITARQAVDLFLTPLARPGGAPRTVHVGGPADLCLLAQPLHEALADPAATQVVATVIAGTVHGVRPGRSRSSSEATETADGSLVDP